MRSAKDFLDKYKAEIITGAYLGTVIFGAVKYLKLL